MLDGAKLFDPEYVGYMLMAVRPVPNRRLSGTFRYGGTSSSRTMSGLAQQYPHPWVAPMSLINPA
jgi:hypothetical protein